MTLDALQALADQLKTNWRLDSWTVTVKELPLAEREDKERNVIVWGDCEPHGASESCSIRINPDGDEQMQRHTLYHEMAHLRLEGHDCESFYERGVDILSGKLCA